jgi:TctA family transporter
MTNGKEQERARVTQLSMQMFDLWDVIAFPSIGYCMLDYSVLGCAIVRILLQFILQHTALA